MRSLWNLGDAVGNISELAPLLPVRQVRRPPCFVTIIGASDASDPGARFRSFSPRAYWGLRSPPEGSVHCPRHAAPNITELHRTPPTTEGLGKVLEKG